MLLTVFAFVTDMVQFLSYHMVLAGAARLKIGARHQGPTLEL